MTGRLHDIAAKIISGIIGKVKRQERETLLFRRAMILTLTAERKEAVGIDIK